MQVSRTIWNALLNLVAADTATLAAATAMKVYLVASSFAPSLDLVIGDLTLATFTGSAAKSAGIGVAQVFVDPTTGGRTCQILEPAGGWTWICTATPGAAETVYGYILTDTAGTGLLGSGLLSQAITIALSGQAVTIPSLRFNLPTSAPSN